MPFLNLRFLLCGKLMEDLAEVANTVGRDEEAIRAYFRNQEKEDQRLDQLNIWR